MSSLFTDLELSKFLKVSDVTLWRLRLSGMPYIRVGGQIRYDLEKVLEWLNLKSIDNENEKDEKNEEKEVV